MQTVILIIPLLFTISTTTHAIESTQCNLTGKVIKITDGDTITVLDHQYRQQKIRLSGIDAPERGQPYGRAAKRFLNSLLAGQHICIQSNKRDRYQRIVGKVVLNQTDINIQMIQNGYAWHYKKYQKEQPLRDQITYAQAEVNARSSLTGLWTEPYPIAPWDWRHGTKTTPKHQHISESSHTCGTKRFCRQMTSCSDAKFHHQQCGLSRLDGDHDGIPCESVCR